MNGSDIALDTNAAIALLNSGPELAVILRQWRAPAIPLPVLASLKTALSTRESRSGMLIELSAFCGNWKYSCPIVIPRHFMEKFDSA
jgi:hypothetical protein